VIPRAIAQSALFALIALHGAQRADRFNPLRDSLQRDAPLPVYSSDTSDPWNTVFHLLFTRTIDAHVIADGSKVFAAGDDRLTVSDVIVRRIESGDRAIDPLYSSWVWMGSTLFDMSPAGYWRILEVPQFARFTAALTAVRDSAHQRPALARALMQADLWAVYDLLFVTRSSLGRGRDQRQQAEARRRRAEDLLGLLADAIRALSLTRNEIADLPDTYAAALHRHRLPDLFNPLSRWIEVRWFPERMHERAINDRRAVRVFLAPAARGGDPSSLLNRLRDGEGSDAGGLDEVALLVQTLLIASDGKVVPSPIFVDVQIRSNAPQPNGASRRILQYELSRQHVLRSLEDGFVAYDELAPAYLPFAGNDFSFATATSERGMPTVAPLRDRCQVCHGSGLGTLGTFSMIRSPGHPAPPVERLTPAEHRHAWDVAARKMTREEFASLTQQWPR
jgi:hypothetical protein